MEAVTVSYPGWDMCGQDDPQASFDLMDMTLGPFQEMETWDRDNNERRCEMKRRHFISRGGQLASFAYIVKADTVNTVKAAKKLFWDNV